LQAVGISWLGKLHIHAELADAWFQVPQFPAGLCREKTGSLQAPAGARVQGKFSLYRYKSTNFGKQQIVQQRQNCVNT
jgi:hypothetical protein